MANSKLETTADMLWSASEAEQDETIAYMLALTAHLVLAIENLKTFGHSDFTEGHRYLMEDLYRELNAGRLQQQPYISEHKPSGAWNPQAIKAISSIVRRLNDLVEKMKQGSLLPKESTQWLITNS